nr:MAG TPA: fatty acid synthase-like protein [Caudoviricetes sp.]
MRMIYVRILKKTISNMKKNIKESVLNESMDELMRVLKPGGTLIFKWNEHQIKVSSVLEAIKPYQPLFGHPTRRNDTTIWMSFMKF